ncbi:isocitrate lyase/PEP mutase family protein [Ovoidimarina sediminis]|uniref:isocitrate lyase/PEP mutase family protein n=1 Tax=Ovoidimarina sediminis TaxID=3079856 RepID=UPI002913E692|nr:isocitrate lyase/phosphoenolpyruvate mutase family protein [Rhodophyticola sp. MJ-SS7]MDU8943143.1 isocitrate lyase/phosphoenolpyruvate mutase family protein [Rhodophyticola sp. MJ-SS7]
MTDQTKRHARFRALHEGPRPFLLPNAWDAGSARLLASRGFQALGTTSAGFAFSKGLRDSFAGLSREALLENAAEIAAATDLPVSADLEDGFGAAPETVAETIRLATAAGLVGGTIEDATGDADDPLYDFGLAVERIAAAREAARDLPFVLTARAEGFLWGRHDLDDAIRRLQAFAEAGADVLYAPGLPNLDAIRTVCASVDRPVNVLMGLTGPRYTVDELAEAGARRISTGGALARTALGALARAADEMLGQGTFGFAEDAMPSDEITALMSEEKAGNRA